MLDVDPNESQPERIERDQAQLRQEREELRGIVDLIPQTIILLNPNGKAIYANRDALEYTGLSLDEVQSDDFRDRIFHHEDVQRLREERQKSLSGTIPFENEQRVLGKDGKYRWFLIRYSPLLDENGKVVRWYATPTDIEDRKQAQEALRNALDQVQKSEAKLRQVIDTVPTMAWCNLADGPNEFLNKRWHEYTGLSPEESHGWGWQAAFHPEDLGRLTEKWQEQLGSGESGEIEARVRRYDGVYRWFLIRMAPFRDENGKIVRWYGASTDIETLKRTEEKLREDERELRQITDAIPQAIVVQDPSGLPIYANRATLDYTGLTADDVITPNFRERIFHPEDVERFRKERKAALARGVPSNSSIGHSEKTGDTAGF
jgi:PAS domain S-box-containing protein